MNRLDQIEARANAATEGPWTTYTVTPHMGSEVLTAPREGEDYGDYVVPEYIDMDNAAFIAHARTDVPALVAALRAVLKLHKEDGHGWGPGESFCTECQQGYGLLVPYPCPTVTAIRQHLGDDK